LDRKDKNGKWHNLDIYGEYETQAHRRLELTFKPCTPNDTSDPSNPQNIKDNPCGSVNWKDKKATEKKKQEAIAKLGVYFSPDIQIMTNQMRKNRAPYNLFDSKSRDSGGILRYSHLQNKQFLANQPSFIDVQLRKSVYYNEEDLNFLSFVNSKIKAEKTFVRTDYGIVQPSAWI